MTQADQARGARLIEAVEVMDRLRSPGGCPWDAEQTHESLARYLVEETYETLEAIDTGDRRHLAEELGDVLLQVLFHARVAQDDPREAFDIDDVASLLVEKLRRRHPHVFADGDATTPAEVEVEWERIKAEEHDAKRASAAAGGAQGYAADSLARGIPRALPSLLQAQKVADRMARRGASLESALPLETDRSLGEQLLALVGQAREAGLVAEDELRRALALVVERVDDAESAQTRADGSSKSADAT